MQWVLSFLDQSKEQIIFGPQSCLLCSNIIILFYFVVFNVFYDIFNNLWATSISIRIQNLAFGKKKEDVMESIHFITAHCVQFLYWCTFSFSKPVYRFCNSWKFHFDNNLWKLKSSFLCLNKIRSLVD
jgi:hypothetical protein